MLFNPEESIDFNGNTAPFIQYTHARICSLIRKATEHQIDMNYVLHEHFTPSAFEKELLKKLYDYPQVVMNAGREYSPALIANYIYDLAKEFNRFYQETPIFKEENSEKQIFRLQLSSFIADIIKKGMGLLDIQVPERM
jgi:arginyl-tRNA synthetase